MATFKTVTAQEVWIHNKRVGFIVEQWFYPAPGIQLGDWEMREIIEAMNHSAPKEIPYRERGRKVSSGLSDPVTRSMRNPVRRHDGPKGDSYWDHDPPVPDDVQHTIDECRRRDGNVRTQ